MAIFDLWDKRVDSKTWPIDLEANQSKQLEFKPSIKKFGIYRVELKNRQLDRVVDEITFSYMPQTRMYDSLGTHALFDDQSLMIAQKLGFKWLRHWESSRPTAWLNVMPRDANYDWSFSDHAINKAHRMGFKQVGVLFHYLPAWAYNWKDYTRPHWLYKKAGNNNKGSVLLETPELINGWKKYVKDVVNRYQKQVTDWEVLNEPYEPHFGDWTPQQYSQLLQLTAPIIRSANPQARVLGPCTHVEGGFADACIRLGVLENIDVFTFHGYFSTTESMQNVKKNRGTQQALES